jgi:L,D-transpeptidase catalytic domain
MQGRCRRATIATLISFLGFHAAGQEPESPPDVIISVAEQKLMVVRDGMWTHKFRVSTSKFGLGDSYGSYKTPLGKLRVCDKIGTGLNSGSVIKHRHATGEILPVNAPGRDPIVTRILWLEGLEPGNQHAKARGIYIHGTIEESKIGDAVSYGCIRMRSHDVIEVYDAVPVGSLVTIQHDRLPRLRRWMPQPASIIAANKSPAGNEVDRPVKPIAERLDAAPEPHRVTEKIPDTRGHGLFVGEGHRVLSKKAAVEMHRAHAPAFSNASEAMKGSILFADLPGLETKGKQ